MKLHPIDPSLAPFAVGERVAFKEDHSKHPGKYGSVRAIGLDPDGGFGFDLLVFDPAVGLTGEEKTVFRSTMEDIQ